MDMHNFLRAKKFQPEAISTIWWWMNRVAPSDKHCSGQKSNALSLADEETKHGEGGKDWIWIDWGIEEFGTDESGLNDEVPESGAFSSRNCCSLSSICFFA